MKTLAAIALLFAATTANAAIYRLTGTDPDVTEGVPKTWQIIVATDDEVATAITLMAKNVPGQSDCTWATMTDLLDSEYFCYDDAGTSITLNGDGTADYSSDVYAATYQVTMEPYALKAVIGSWANNVMATRLRPMKANP